MVEIIRKTLYFKDLDESITGQQLMGLVSNPEGVRDYTLIRNSPHNSSAFMEFDTQMAAISELLTINDRFNRHLTHFVYYIRDNLIPYKKWDERRKYYLIISDLNPNTTEQTLKEFFSRFGEILLVCLLDKCNAGSALVTYGTIQEAMQALNVADKTEFDGSIIRVTWSFPLHAIHPNEVTSSRLSCFAKSNNCEIYCGMFDQELDLDLIYEKFNKFGTVLEFNFLDSGYVFVTYGRKWNARLAIENYNNKCVAGTNVRCNWSHMPLIEISYPRTPAFKKSSRTVSANLRDEPSNSVNEPSQKNVKLLPTETVPYDDRPCTSSTLSPLRFHSISRINQLPRTVQFPIMESYVPYAFLVDPTPVHFPNVTSRQVLPPLSPTLVTRPNAVPAVGTVAESIPTSQETEIITSQRRDLGPVGSIGENDE